MEDLAYRKEVARQLLSGGMTPLDEQLEVDLTLLPAEAALTADLGIPFPVELTPTPQSINPVPKPQANLPHADVVVVTWTIAEQNALADVLTPGKNRNAWYRYNRFFEERYESLVRKGAPASQSRRLGSYFMAKVGAKSVLCYKSELHLNQDSIPDPNKPGTATLPVRNLFIQIIDEVKPDAIITTGTSGGVTSQHGLGDVVVTRGAKFRLADEFRNESFNNKTFTNNWRIPTQYFDKATELMQRFVDRVSEPAFGFPTKRYPFQGPLLRPKANPLQIHLDDRDMPRFHPILTTDFFEYGTSENNLYQEGCAVEMGDAVLGLVCSEMNNHPKWVVVRNLSDPEINGDLPTGPTGRGLLNMQTHWAVWYYEAYGYWTSTMSALTCWAIIAGL